MAARPVEYSKGGLAKRTTAGGWRWAGQVKWRYVGETKWRTKLRVLTDDNGAPIMTDQRKVDPETGEDVNNRGIKKARKAYDKWLRELGHMSYDNTLSVREYLVGYIDTLKSQNDAARKKGIKLPYSPSTLRGYTEYVPIIADGFQGKPMASIDTTDVYKWVQSMKDNGLAASTMRKALSVLSTCCDHATMQGDMPGNPCGREIRNSIERASMQEPNHLSPESINRVNRLLDNSDNPRLRIGARIALHCGLRAGEICALRWCDVDLDSMRLRIRESIINRGGGTESSSPKSFAGTRDVDMTPALAHELNQWREVQATEWATMWVNPDGTAQPDAAPFDDCRVIGYADGRWYTPNSLGHLWNRLAKGRHERDPKDRRKAGAGYIEGHEPILGMTGEQIRLHDLRHTFATYHIATGTNVVRTATLMGHADPAVTMRRYAGRIKDPAIIDAIEGKSAADILSSGTSWADQTSDQTEG